MMNLALISGLGLPLIRMVLYMMGPEAFVQLEKNPWEGYLNMNMTYFSLLIFPLVIIAITSLIIHQEDRADSWRILLTLPNPRWQLLGGKLVITVLFTAGVLLLFLLASYLLAFPVYWLHPETEFGYFFPHFSEIGSDAMKVLVYSLGVIGLQFTFSLLFKNQVFPLSLGVILLVVGFICYMAFPALAAYFPYAFPMQYKDIGISPSLNMEQVSGTGWKSILVFTVSAVLSYYIFVSRKSVA
ncbi:MAG: ABC transporter permease [Lewinella sp.]|nr:ABC transporter permease [Lewinella sp.]